MQQDNIRYSRLTDIIELLFYMLKHPEGITIKEIENKFGVSRRTAERMKDALLNVIPEIDVMPDTL